MFWQIVTPLCWQLPPLPKRANPTALDAILDALGDRFGFDLPPIRKKGDDWPTY